MVSGKNQSLISAFHIFLSREPTQIFFIVAQPLTTKMVGNGNENDT